MILTEGLKEGDLEGLVLPIISVDEFESKLDDDSIVVGFYVEDKDPASDLNRFIQKGSVAVLDTDVSPAPNEDGYFMVFVEMLRDNNFPKKILSILESLENLVMVQNWTMIVYGSELTQEASLENIQSQVRLKSEVEPDVEMGESLNEFFQNSLLDGLTYSDGKLTFSRRGLSETYELIDFDTLDELNEHNAVMSLPVLLNEDSQRIRRTLETLLGDHWLVEHLGSYVVVSRFDEPKMALLRL